MHLTTRAGLMMAYVEIAERYVKRGMKQISIGVWIVSVSIRSTSRACLMEVCFERAIQMGEKMSIKSKNVKLSIIPARVSKLMQLGRENRLHNVNGSLKLTTICSKIINFILELHADTKIQAYLKQDGGTLFGLIRRAIHRYISD